MWGHIKKNIANLLTRWYLIFIFILFIYFVLPTPSSQYMGEEQVWSSKVTPGSCLVRSGQLKSGQVRSGQEWWENVLENGIIIC
jgi:hypothetical protein